MKEAKNMINLRMEDPIDLKILMQLAKEGDLPSFKALQKGWGTLPSREYKRKISPIQQAFYRSINQQINNLSAELINKYAYDSRQRQFDIDSSNPDIRPMFSYDNDQDKIDKLMNFADMGNSNAQFAIAMIYKYSDPELYHKYLSLANISGHSSAIMEIATAMNEEINGFSYNAGTITSLLHKVAQQNPLLKSSVNHYVQEYTAPEIKQAFFLQSLKKALNDGFGVNTTTKDFNANTTVFMQLVGSAQKEVLLNGYNLAKRNTAPFKAIRKLLTNYSIENLLEDASEGIFMPPEAVFDEIYNILDRASQARPNRFLPARFFGGHDASDIRMYNLLSASLYSARHSSRHLVRQESEESLAELVKVTEKPSNSYAAMTEACGGKGEVNPDPDRFDVENLNKESSIYKLLHEDKGGNLNKSYDPIEPTLPRAFRCQG